MADGGAAILKHGAGRGTRDFERNRCGPDDALRGVVRRAEEIARLAPPDPEFLPSLGSQEYPPSEAWDADAARLDEVIRCREVGGRAVPFPIQASGSVSALADADVLAWLPWGRTHFGAGDAVRVSHL